MYQIQEGHIIYQFGSLNGFRGVGFYVHGELCKKVIGIGGEGQEE